MLRAGIAVLVVAALMPLGAQHATLQSGGSIQLDMDATNGQPCASIDSSIDVETGQTFKVAVCMSGLPEQPAAFDYEILYDDQVLRVPDKPDEGTGLDDNPDANAGATTFGSSQLGEGWDCSGATLKYAQGDADTDTGAGHGRTLSGGCMSVAGPYSLGTTGVLGVVDVVALAPGSASMTLTKVVITGESGIEAGTCDPGIFNPIECGSGNVTITGAPVTMTPEPTATLMPGETPAPGETVTEGTPDGGGSGGQTGTPGSGGQAGGTPGANATPSGSQRTATAAAAEGKPSLTLDANISNGDGPCDIIDDEATIEKGGSVEVAACLTFPNDPPATFEVTVLYDEKTVNGRNVRSCDGNLQGGEVEGSRSALDCNPDINAGETTFGTSLGEGWSCSLEGEGEPWGNGPAEGGDAYTGVCISVAGPYTLKSPGALAVFTFDGVADGSTDLAMKQVVVTAASGLELGSCNPAITTEMTCLGATIKVGSGGGGGGGGTAWWPFALGGAVVVVAAGGGGYWYWMRRRAR